MERKPLPNSRWEKKATSSLMTSNSTSQSSSIASLVTKWPPRRVGFKDIVHTLERIVNDFQLNVLITHSTLWNGPEEVAKFVEWRRNIKALGGYQAPLIFCHMSHFQEPYQTIFPSRALFQNGLEPSLSKNHTPSCQPHPSGDALRGRS